MSEVGLWLVLPASAESVDACLGSVAAQTVMPCEVVVVDDGADGDAGATAERWSGRLPLRIVRREPGDPGGAAGIAARNSTAPRIARLDGADSWLPDHLATLVRAMGDENTIVSPRALDWDPANGVALHKAKVREFPTANAQLAAIYARNFVSPQALFSRALYERVGGARTELRESTDWDLWIRLLRAGARAVTTDHATVLRRRGMSAPDSLRVAAAECDVEVMRRATTEAADESERARAMAAARRLGARLEYVRSVEQARNGRGWAARRSAIAALRAGGRSAPWAWLMAVTPESAVRVEARREARRGSREVR
jgi:glycosyltransferase involved in cell wall biosynthesis